MKKLSASVLLGLVLMSGSALAKDGAVVDFDVVDDYGRTMPEYAWRYQTYVAGNPGMRYNLRLRNNTGQRVLAVVAVDGVNVISGQTASVSQQGYVLNPYQSIEVDGWRKSMRDVARFYFTDIPDSYAGRTGRGHQVGVMGLAVFTERRYYPQPRVIYNDSRAAQEGAPAPSAAPQSARSASMERNEGVAADIGTGHGERQTSWANRTTFERSSNRPVQLTEIRYNSYPKLVQLGIAPRNNYRYRYRNDREAFPSDFVPDPR